MKLGNIEAFKGKIRKDGLNDKYFWWFKRQLIDQSNACKIDWVKFFELFEVNWIWNKMK